MAAPASPLQFVSVDRARGLEWQLDDAVDAVVHDIAASHSPPLSEEATEALAAEYRDFALTVSLVVGTHYGKLKRRLRNAFSASLPVPRRRFHQPSRSSFATATDEGNDVDTPNNNDAGAKHKERLLDLGMDVATLLSAAEYVPLSSAQYRLALDSNFDFALPNGTDWEALDGELLPALMQRLWRGEHPLLQQPEEGRPGARAVREIVSAVSRATAEDAPAGTYLPNFSRHLLVAVRGYHVQTRTDFFLWRKLDLVILALWAYLAVAVEWVVLKVTKDPKRAKELGEKFAALMTVGNEATDAREGPTSPSDASTTSASGTIPLSHAAPNDVKLERHTLEDEVAAHGLLAVLPRRVTVREPCFDSVIVMYEEAHRRPSAAEAAAPKASAEQPATGETREQPEPWRLEAFRNVPFGDLEMVLPHKKLGMLPIDTLRTVAGFVAMLVCLSVSLNEIFVRPAEYPSDPCASAGDNAAGSSNVVGATVNFVADAVDTVQDEVSFWVRAAAVGAIAAAIAVRLVTLGLGYMTTMTFYRADIQQWLLRKRVARGRNVVGKLVDEVTNQDVLEVLLGRYALDKLELQRRAARRSSSAPGMPGSSGSGVDALGTPRTHESSGDDGWRVGDVRAVVEELLREHSVPTSGGGTADGITSPSDPDPSSPDGDVSNDSLAVQQDGIRTAEFDAADALWKLVSLGLAREVGRPHGGSGPRRGHGEPRSFKTACSMLEWCGRYPTEQLLRAQLRAPEAAVE